MTLKLIIALAVISLFLGITIYVIRVILIAYKIYKESMYKLDAKYYRELLLILQDEALRLRDNVEQNVALIEFDGTDDIVYYIYSKRPGVDRDGEIFAYIGIMPVNKPIIYKDLDPMYIYDTKTGKEYCQCSKSAYKRSEKMHKILSSEDPDISVNVTWSSETEKTREIRRDFILDNLERGRLP